MRVRHRRHCVGKARAECTPCGAAAHAESAGRFVAAEEAVTQATFKPFFRREGVEVRMVKAPTFMAAIGRRVGAGKCVACRRGWGRRGGGNFVVWGGIALRG